MCFLHCLWFFFFATFFLSPCLWIDGNSFRHEHNKGSTELEVETVTWWVRLNRPERGFLFGKGNGFWLSSGTKERKSYKMEWGDYIYGKSWAVVYRLRALVFAVVLRPRQWLTTTCNSNSEGFHTLLWTPQLPGTHMVHIHKCRQNINTHLKWIWKKMSKREYIWNTGDLLGHSLRVACLAISCYGRWQQPYKGKTPSEMEFGVF